MSEMKSVLSKDGKGEKLEDLRAVELGKDVGELIS